MGIDDPSGMLIPGQYEHLKLEESVDRTGVEFHGSYDPLQLIFWLQHSIPDIGAMKRQTW